MALGTNRIKFRGKPTYGDGWVYGYLVCFGVEHQIIDCSGRSCVVDGSTVSQFTGLTDKQSQDIYGSDFLGSGSVEPMEVVFEDGSFRLDAKSEQQTNGAITQERVRRLVIMGNRHDNPELLGA
ncbi:YopX family protein [Hydrogenovibrio marinus]|uniref:YopX protein domain-containing protein n=1 Tax=Hydrogenovibrio marinus TaxID=28885 RepID=A0A066ZXA6_HYDMR|nr:YopX family protein [Hydrogenovibrio marinus]KDN94700.1 hypothetical protein EI16_12450 [Hydrogenovibrio marinus]